uniref:Major Facilitator Superfamily, putative n=1 Tax=Theileria annulata TaxID=5874 RepID=A0A3B0N3R3_THEAN
MKIFWLYRLIFYFIISMTIGPFYDGWSSTAKYLISEGVFSKLCKNVDDPPKLFYLKPLCDNQAYNVGRLLSFYRISEFLSSIFTGIFMDNVGPKITVLLSIVLRVISWVLIPTCNNVHAVIILSCILCGISSNGIAFPVFTIAQYSKKFFNVCMIAISVSLSFGTFYTFILNRIKYSLHDHKPINIIVVMLILTHLPIFILSSILFPNLLEKDVKLNIVDELNSKRTKTASNDEAEDVFVHNNKWEFRTFLSILGRIDILVLSFASMVNVISLTFAQESFPILYGDNKTALTVNEILIPLSFIFSILSTFVLNKVGSVPIILFLNVVSAVMHMSLFFTNLPASIFTSILMSLNYSLFMTQYYIYLDSQVPIQYQGSIKGFLVTLIGFVLFVNIGLNYLSKTYFYTREIHLALMAIRLLVSLPLYFFLRRELPQRSRSFDKP